MGSFKFLYGSRVKKNHIRTARCLSLRHCQRTSTLPISVGSNNKIFNRSKQEQLESVAYLWFFACLSQKGMCTVSGMAHRGQRSEEIVEFRKARQFCFVHSNFGSKLQERIFLGTPEAVKTFVEAAVVDPYLADILDVVQGLVLADNRCRGAFQ